MQIAQTHSAHSARPPSAYFRLRCKKIQLKWIQWPTRTACPASEKCASKTKGLSMLTTIPVAHISDDKIFYYSTKYDQHCARASQAMCTRNLLNRPISNRICTRQIITIFVLFECSRKWAQTKSHCINCEWPPYFKALHHYRHQISVTSSLEVHGARYSANCITACAAYHAKPGIKSTAQEKDRIVMQFFIAFKCALCFSSSCFSVPIHFVLLFCFFLGASLFSHFYAAVLNILIILLN